MRKFFLYLFWQCCSSFENETKIPFWRTNNRFTPMHAGRKILCVLKCSRGRKIYSIPIPSNSVPPCDKKLNYFILKVSYRLYREL